MTVAYMTQVYEEEEKGSPFWANVDLFKDLGEALNRAANIALEKSEKTRVIQLADNGVRWNVTGEATRC